jgi:hypothetical protein
MEELVKEKYVYNAKMWQTIIADQTSFKTLFAGLASKATLTFSVLQPNSITVYYECSPATHPNSVDPLIPALKENLFDFFENKDAMSPDVDFLPVKIKEKHLTGNTQRLSFDEFIEDIKKAYPANPSTNLQASFLESMKATHPLSVSFSFADSAPLSPLSLSNSQDETASTSLQLAKGELLTTKPKTLLSSIEANNNAPATKGSLYNPDIPLLHGVISCVPPRRR